MKPFAAAFALIALTMCASPAWAGAAPVSPADRLAAPAALPQLPLTGDFYRVKVTGGEGPSYMRTPSPGGQADGWLIEVLRKPQATDKGPADLVAGYFHFECEAGSAEIVSMVFYSSKGLLVDRYDEKIVPKFVKDSPIWLLKEAACGRPPANLDHFTTLEAVVADAATR